MSRDVESLHVMTCFGHLIDNIHMHIVHFVSL